MRAKQARKTTLRRLALDVVDLFRLCGSGPVSRREAARVWGVPDPDSVSAKRRWERWKARMRREGKVAKQATTIESGDDHGRDGNEILLWLKPEALAWANGFLDENPTRSIADTWHCWETVVDEVPGRVRCTKCGLERGRLDKPFPSCPNSSLTS